MGWQPLPPYLQTPLRVLDVGCGNGRFARFLVESLDGSITYRGIDNNPTLLDSASATLASISNLDATLSEQDVIEGALPDETYDLVVLFGVIHHVPGAQNRLDFMRRLAGCVGEQGLLCFASWRFHEYERFRSRYTTWDNDIAVEQHDYLLDWRNGERALRYCHYVDDTEQAQLEAATGLEVITRYRADGSDNAMNQYVLLRRP